MSSYEAGLFRSPGDIEERLRKRFPNILVEGRILQEFRNGLLHHFAELLIRHGSARAADNRKVRRNSALKKQAIQRRKELSLGQIAAGAEDDDGARRNPPIKPQLS